MAEEGASKTKYNEKRLKVTIVAQTNLSKRVTLSTLVQQVSTPLVSSTSLSCPLPVMNSTTRPSRERCHSTTTSSPLSLLKVGRLPLPLSRLPYRNTCNGILPPPSLSSPRTSHHPVLLLVPSPHPPLP